MLIIRKITHRKNSLKRKLQLSVEALSLCNLVIVKEFDYTLKQNSYYIFFHKPRVKNTPP